MKRSALRAAAASLLSVVLLAFSVGPVNAEPTASVDVLGFQDAHEFEPQTRKDGKQYGGIARLATVLSAARAEQPNSITAFGGDQVGGTLFGAVYRGVPFVDAFNGLGVDVAGFGQHDFDFGADHTRSLIERARFPWISANLTSGGKPFSPDGRTAVVEKDGVKIGFLSLTSALDSTIVANEVKQEDYVASAKAAVAELAATGAQAIIALTQTTNGDARAVLEAVPQIDAAMTEEVSGSSPVTIEYASGERPVVSPAADYGAVIRFRIDVNGDKVVTRPSVLAVDDTVAEDPGWAKRTTDLMSEMNTKLATKVGEASKDLDRATLGGIVAQAYRAHERADIGWQNGGGIRSETGRGSITQRDVLSVLPFANGLVSIKTTGAKLKDALEQAVESDPTGRGGGYPRTAGLAFDVNPDGVMGQRVTNLRTDQGEAISLEGTYTVALTQYVLNGGNSVVAFKDADLLTAQPTVDAEVFEEYIHHHGVIPVAKMPAPTPSPSPTQTALPIPEPTEIVSPSVAPTTSAKPTAKPMPDLPITGAQMVGLLAIGGLLLLGGLGAIAWSRRNKG